MHKEERNKRARERYRRLNPTEVLPEGLKRCGTCQEIKPKTEFGKLTAAKDGLRYSCKDCRKQEYLENQEHNIARSKRYYRENKDEISKKNKEYKERNREWYRKYDKAYYLANAEVIKENVKEYHFDRMERDPSYKLLVLYRTRLYQALKGQTKSASTRKLIGCSIEKLKKHIEAQFQEGMNWDNYGEWHVDHIKPCAAFDFTKEEEQKECFHYTNLQPLWAEDNQRKSDNYEAS